LPPVGQCRTIVPIFVSILLFFIFKHQQHFSPKVDNLLPGIVEHSLIFLLALSHRLCATLRRMLRLRAKAAIYCNAPLDGWALTISRIALATGSYVFSRLGNRVLAHGG